MAQLPLTFQKRREPSESPRVFSVSELARRLRGELERTHPRVLVEGEVSNLKINHVSGHAYFTLKDRSAQLNCVMWRDNVRRLRFRLEEGQTVIANGRVTVYERGGRLQLSVAGVELRGLGALREAYRQLAERLRQEGLTTPQRKAMLPMWPSRVGIVTSRDAAALRDVVRTILRRDPRAHILICPTPVQGRLAAPDVADAIRYIDRNGDCDVVLVVRGGGSIEDLWAFNEESVARAIATARTPIVTGVGHETDTTIADLVADRAASTPTAAAEIVMPVRAEIRQRWLDTENRLHRAMSTRIREHTLRLRALESRLVSPAAMLHRRSQRLDELMMRAERALRDRVRRDRGSLTNVQRRLDARAPGRRIQRLRGELDVSKARLTAEAGRHLEGARNRLLRAIQRLELLNPLSILERGYAVAHDPDGKAIRDVDSVAVGDQLMIRLARGQLRVTVADIDPGASPDDED